MKVAGINSEGAGRSSLDLLIFFELYNVEM